MLLLVLFWEEKPHPSGTPHRFTHPFNPCLIKITDLCSRVCEVTMLDVIRWFQVLFIPPFISNQSAVITKSDWDDRCTWTHTSTWCCSSPPLVWCHTPSEELAFYRKAFAQNAWDGRRVVLWVHKYMYTPTATHSWRVITLMHSHGAAEYFS